MKPDMLERDYVIGGQALHDALTELRAEAPRTSPADAAEYILRTAAQPWPAGIYVTRPQLRAALESMPVWVRCSPRGGAHDATIIDPDAAADVLLGNLGQIEPGKPVASSTPAVDEPAGEDPVDCDDELMAMASLRDILSTLNYEEQRRVLAWAADRFCGAGLDA